MSSAPSKAGFAGKILVVVWKESYQRDFGWSFARVRKGRVGVCVWVRYDALKFRIAEWTVFVLVDPTSLVSVVLPYCQREGDVLLVKCHGTLR